MAIVGIIVHLQVQTSSLKTGVRPRRVYDPSPLRSVERLRLAPGGVIGVARDGTEHPDVHHPAHPRTKRADGREASVGFTSHYDKMQARFGARIRPGCAGENILIESDRAWALEDFSPGLAFRSRRDGSLLRLANVTVAAPCVEFSRFSMDDPYASPHDLKPVLQFLDEGVRGYCFTPAGDGVVEVGDTLETLESVSSKQ